MPELRQEQGKQEYDAPPELDPWNAFAASWSKGDSHD